MSDSINCEKCGKEGRRRRFYPCPEGWWWIEIKIDGVTMMGHACSVECKDALWQEGPGKRWTSEEMDKTLAEEEWPMNHGRPVPACQTCGRPVWDGGHALNERECSQTDGEVCKLHGKVKEMKGLFLARSKETADLREALAEATKAHHQEVWKKLDNLANNLITIAEEIDRPIVRWLAALVESDADRHIRKYGHQTMGHARAAEFISRLLRSVVPPEEYPIAPSSEDSMEKLKKSYKGWAEMVALNLTDNELNELTALLDGDAGNDFYYFLNEINAARNPHEYQDPPEAKTQEASSPSDGK